MRTNTLFMRNVVPLHQERSLIHPTADLFRAPTDLGTTDSGVFKITVFDGAIFVTQNLTWRGVTWSGIVIEVAEDPAARTLIGSLGLRRGQS